MVSAESVLKRIAPDLVEVTARKLETEQIVRRGLRVAEYREPLTILAQLL